MGFWKDRKGYRVYCGIDDSGKPIRKYVSTVEDAKHLLATYRLKKGRYDADLLALPEKAKIEVYTVLLKCTELGVSLSELLDFYCEKTGKSSESKTCRECADLYLQNMTEANRRWSSIHTMDWFLKKFFYSETPIRALTFETVKTMFDKRPQKSKTGFKRCCSAFFNFCLKRKLCDTNFALDLTPPKLEQTRPPILTVAQARKLLTETNGEVLTAIVICMFCGLRPTEYKRLTKQSIDLEKGIVTIDSHMAKTHSFRLVKIPENAVQWLRKFGIHLPKVKTARPALTARAVLGYKEWPHDVLRHTAASYMLARDKSADAVALQLGNSPDILHKHYKNLVTDAEAEEFWNLTPDALGRDY